MPRRSSGSRRSAPTQRQAPTQSHVPAQAAPQVPAQSQPRQPGLLGQMAAQAGSIAVGSTVGHVVGSGISRMLFGGSNDHQQVQSIQQEQPQFQQQQQQDLCGPDQKAFLNCLEKNQNDISACQFYLDMYKQCQASQQTQ